MSRNNQSYFASQPDVNISRSRFKIPFSHKTTMNSGQLIPFYLSEILPGDSVTMDTTALFRMSTPIFPVMDQCYADIYYFYCPSRILWDHWKELNGENNNTPWTENVEYMVPVTTAPYNTGWQKGSIADYMGIPTQVEGIQVSSLPFRAYVQIWNEFFRDTNYMRPAAYSTGDNNQEGYRNDYAPTAVLNSREDPRFYALYSAIGGGKPLPVSKAHDYFTSCLPQAQRGDPVKIPVFGSASDDQVFAPVGALFDTYHDVSDGPLSSLVEPTSGNRYLAIDSGGNMVFSEQNFAGNVEDNGFVPDNLWANLSNVNLGTISDLRQAFALQKLLETDGRYGSRYTSVLYGHFGVSSPDSRLQRPEYLGGNRIYINIDQVIQTSATNDVSPQGNTAAFSLTVNTDNSFTKSFVEHGYIIGVCCIRTDHTYQQGLNQMWTRRRRFDFYWPELANISAMPIYRREIYATGNSTLDDEVFGYQEPWATYRYMPNRVSGAFRSNVDGTLDSWHYADYFTGADNGAFIANGAFMCETPDNIDRTLAVSGQVEDQFLCDFYCNATFTRPMPIYSIPGLTGHM